MAHRLPIISVVASMSLSRWYLIGGTMMAQHPDTDQ
jgi:hypothetical protein